MLDSMRRHANSWVFSLLFAVIIFVFAVNFGPWAGHVSVAHTYAAEVNGHVIGVSEFYRALDEEIRVQQQQSNPNFTREMAFKTQLPKRIIEGLVQRELLAQQAEANGIVISDEELGNAITGGRPMDENFYRDNVASKTGMTISEFERRVRRDMLASRMYKLVLSGIPISESDLKTSFFIHNDKVSVDYIRVDSAHFEGADKKIQMEAARKYADDIVKELALGKKLEKVERKDLVKKENGSLPGNKESAPVFARTDLFARNDPFVRGLGYMAAEFRESAFALSDAAKFSPQPVLSGDKIYILELKERKHPDASQFEKDKATLKQTIMAERGQEVLDGFIDQLKKKTPPVYNEALLSGQGVEFPTEG